ncbi:MAG: peptidoglycan DD-metalloendopeptidase family protein [Rhodothermales bacterium]|nr:peptidoglycan DD-metalloendopeptidase family protein [Rhodothermales bacterium]
MYESTKSPPGSRLAPLVKTILVAALALVVARPATAQDRISREETEQRLEELRDLISKDQDRLSKTTKQEQASLKTLRNLDRQIAMREELMRNYRTRLDQLQRQQDTLRTSLTLLEEDLGRLRDEYRGRAGHAYKYGRTHDLALILAAESINQMLIRVQYLRRFSNQRRKRLDAIRESTVQINRQRDELAASYLRNEQLLEAAEAEQARLADLKTDRSRVVRKLRRERQSIEKDLENRQSTVRQLESRIREIIAAEARRTGDRSAEALRASAELTAAFVSSKGRLTWPSRGVVKEPFGDIVNPVHGTSVPNPGILIATESSAAVKAAFEGRVISVDIIPDFGTYVVIEHGEYHTVYSNFSLLYVGQNEVVSSGQVIGRAGTDSEPKGPGIFFAVFKKGEPMNPVPWLTRL